MNRVLHGLLAVATLWLSGCVFHSHATELNGVPGVRGEPIEYQTTTSIALHGLFIFPLWGDATKDTVIEQFSAEASERGASRMRISQTSGLTYWFFPPPLSFFIHLVVTSVEGDVEGTV